jgi:hypothetical protein
LLGTLGVEAQLEEEATPSDLNEETPLGTKTVREKILIIPYSIFWEISSLPI